MKKTLKVNFVFNTTLIAFNTLISFFTTGYLARVLGPNNIGLYSYAYSIVSYFVLFGGIGTYQYACREIAYKRDDKEEISRTFIEIILLRLMLCSIAFVIYLVSMSFSSFDKKLVFVLSFFIVNQVTNIRWFFNGVEDFKSVFKVSTIANFIYLASIICFVRSSDSFLYYVIIEVSYQVLNNLFLWLTIHGRIIIVGDLHPFRHLKESIILFLPYIAAQIYVLLDKTMLGFLSNGHYEENSYYALAEGIVKAFLMIGSSLTSVTSPRIAHLNSNNKQDEIRDTLYESYRIGWFITLPVTVLIIATSGMIVPLYFGPGYERVVLLIQILSPLVVLITFSGVTGNQYLLPCKYTKTQIGILFSGATVNLILNLFLIPRYFSLGASIATICAEGFITIVQLIIVRRFGMIKIIQVIEEGTKYFIATAVLSVFLLLFNDNENIILLLVNVASGTLLYLATLIVLKDSIIYPKVQKLRRKIFYND